MALTVSPHASFDFLVKNIPDWQREVNTLAYRVQVKHTEFVAEYTRLVNSIQPGRRKKSPSVASIHTIDNDLSQNPTLANSSHAADRLPSPPDRAEIDPFEAGNKYLFAQARRKRKPGMSIRSGASGPQKFRNKNQVIIYYDGFLQEHLDSLVRLVGMGRNNLRRGKNSLAAVRGFQLPRIPRSPARGGAPSRALGPRTTSTLFLGKKTQDLTTSDEIDYDLIFLEVDKELESIQSLCETAAHQFLRDGDCQSELDMIKTKLKALRVRAASTAELLQKMEEEQQKKEADCSSSEKTNGSDSETTLSNNLSMDFFFPPKMSAASTPTISQTLDDMKARGAFFGASDFNCGSNPPPLVADDIEVDDEESDQGDFFVDIAAYRVANARRARV